ncbi:response regulator [Cryobacterium fucosi]|uniref:response regulator n=1 Tax=Cryobacterium fucosi TaxID=1259157 RepID=UPI0018E0AE56|nr:response regulator [Cryobacterium fucosi]
MIVEDNRANMKLATLLLTHAGHTVLCAIDAETGLTLARDEQPDLILMDIQLPGMDGLAATALLKRDPATASVPVIALTAMAMKADQEKARVAGCDDYITKPLRYEALYDAIDRLLVGTRPPAGGQSERMHEPTSDVGDGAARLASSHPAARDTPRILVAEDNLTNQKLIVTQLASLGYAADVADDGRQALECWRSGTYALLISDVLMPEMDGYDLTAAIRAQERGLARIPIVALTANALAHEEARWRAVGADEYLSKPLQLASLKAILDKWLPAGRSGSGSSAGADHLTTVDRAVDVAVLARLVGSDPAVILDFLTDFRVSTAEIAGELRDACDDRRALTAGEQAHKLKSSARAVGALALGELCSEIETVAKSGNTDSLTALLPAFEHELRAVNAFLDSWPA